MEHFPDNPLLTAMMGDVQHTLRNLPAVMEKYLRMLLQSLFRLMNRRSLHLF